jgi:hypothetical protein
MSAIPENVRKFEFLMYFAAAVAIGKYLLLHENADLLFVSFWTACVLALIWLTARRRQNWARWLLFILFLFECAEKIFLTVALKIGFESASLYFLISPIEALAYFFVFTGDSVAWFKSEEP